MSDGLNKVFLLGNAGSSATLRRTADGTAVLNFDLATNESWKDRSGNVQKRCDWHHVVVWGKRAEGLARYIVQGTKMHVEGSLRTSSWDDKDGQKHWKTEVVASDIILCGGSKTDGGEDAKG